MVFVVCHMRTEAVSLRNVVYFVSRSVTIGEFPSLTSCLSNEVSICCPETSETKYQLTLRKIPEELKP